MSRAELVRALGAMSEPPGGGHPAIAEALGLPEVPTSERFTEVLVLNVYPYASVFLGAEGMLGGEVRDRVAGFWRALGWTPPAEPDHLAALLGLYAWLRELEDREPDSATAIMRREARRALLWEHLLPWVAPFARAVSRADGAGGPYAAWAALLEDALFAEARELPEPSSTPRHLRDVPPLDGGELGELVGGLLAPVRSGIVLTRRDLAGAAASLGVGLRVGERRFVLGAMLEQDAAGTLGWLAEEAGRWQQAHRSARSSLGAVAEHWEQRASAARALLLRTRAAAEEVGVGAAGG